MAFYYMGAGKGTSKKTGNPFFYASILRFNYFGQWEVKSVYCSESMYKDLLKLQIHEGTPVIIQTGLDSELTDIKTHKEVPELLLDR